MAERTKGPRFYTTSKSAGQSVGEIMGLLSEFGAESFHVQQKDGKPVAIAFVHHGIVYQLQPSLEGLERRLEEQGVMGRVKDVRAVAWAQMRAFLELQLEIVENGIARPSEVFGGYALTSGGRTVAEMIEERHGELMPGESRLLPPGGA